MVVRDLTPKHRSHPRYSVYRVYTRCSCCCTPSSQSVLLSFIVSRYLQSLTGFATPCSDAITVPNFEFWIKLAPVQTKKVACVAYRILVHKQSSWLHKPLDDMAQCKLTLPRCLNLKIDGNAKSAVLGSRGCSDNVLMPKNPVFLLFSMNRAKCHHHKTKITQSAPL